MWKSLVLGDTRKKIVTETLSEEREGSGHCGAVSVRPKYPANKLHFSPVISVMPAGVSHSALPKRFLFSYSEKALYENCPSSKTALSKHLNADWWCCFRSHPCASAQKRLSNRLNCAKCYVFCFSVWNYFSSRSMILPGKTLLIQILSGLQVCKANALIHSGTVRLYRSFFRKEK